MFLGSFYKKLALAFFVLMLIFVFPMKPAYIEALGKEEEEYKFNMSYVYFGDTAEYLTYVDSTRNSIDEISPSYFDINSDGSLKLTKATDAYFISEMHKRGIKVVPFLSNHWNRELGRKALQNRKQLVEQIVSEINRLDLDGVCVDIENLTEVDRDNYTDLVRLLSESIPESKTLAVAVASNPTGKTTGWQGSYDYRALGSYADYIMVMTYDQSYQGGPAGPVASASFVEDSIKYAISYVPNEKVVLGIPFYGRYWKNGASYGGYGISLVDAEKLIAKYRGKVSYDYNAQAAKATITIMPRDAKPSVHGRYLDAGTYTIWYENESSLKYKLKLVKKYNLKGTGSWSLGEEPARTWDYYKLWLNGYYYSDAQGHWAMDTILSVASKGLMIGASSTKFLPDNVLTRAEAAVVFVRAFNLEEKPDEVALYKDVAGHWAEKEIKIATQHGIVLGDGNNAFKPDDPVTRQEIAVILDRVLESFGKQDNSDNIEDPHNDENPSNVQNPYNDIIPENYPWSYESIIKLTHCGIFTGRPDGGFHPTVAAKRAEMAVILERVLDYIK